MTLNDMRDLLTYVWYFFLICLMLYMIISIGYNLIKQIQREKDTDMLIDTLIKNVLQQEQDENDDKNE